MLSCCVAEAVWGEASSGSQESHVYFFSWWVSTRAPSLKVCREVFFFWCPWSGLGDVFWQHLLQPVKGRAHLILGSSTTLVWSQKWLQRSQGQHGGWLSPGGLSLAYRDARARQIQLGAHDMAGLQVGDGCPRHGGRWACSTSWLRLAS